MSTTVSTVCRLALVVALVALALPAFAADLVIENGSDLWRTPGNGTSFVSFKADPIPRDFFCSGSRLFKGNVIVRGVPIVTRPEGALRKTDTIVHRLDDAVFNEAGVATTRVQLRALQFEGVDLLRNECGAFKVNVALSGVQPITEMQIVRQGPDHGYFETEISLNIKISFTPADRRGQVLEITREVNFPRARNLWAARPGPEGIQREGYVQVDTDGNGRVDTFVPGTSRNFAAGVRPDGTSILPELEVGQQLRGTGNLADSAGLLQQAVVACMDVTCHCGQDGTHCPQ